MELSITYVVLDYRFQLSPATEAPDGCYNRKNESARGTMGRKKRWEGARGLAFSLSPSHRPPCALFFSFSLSSPHPKLRAFQFLQQEKQSTANDKWRTFYIVLYASLMTPCDGVTQVLAVV